MYRLLEPLHIVGVELRTTNEAGRSFQEIPPFWDRFIKEDCAKKITSKLDNDIYAVYTHFENAGKNNQGMYSLIIGCSVSTNTQIPNGYQKIIIPVGNYRQFPVEKGRPDKVGAAWQAIWSIPEKEKSNWLFSCEFERYRTTGEIDIFIGLKP